MKHLSRWQWSGLAIAIIAFIIPFFGNLFEYLGAFGILVALWMICWPAVRQSATVGRFLAAAEFFLILTLALVTFIQGGKLSIGIISALAAMGVAVLFLGFSGWLVRKDMRAKRQM